jgi:two-component system response regulator CpxR
LKRGLSGEHNFIILDVKLPGLDGFEVLRQIRDKSDTPILMLTSCNEDADRIKGLELGADEYLNKPFNLYELLARIRTILRRTEKQSGDQKPNILTVGDILLDPGSRRVYRDGEEILLTAAEFSLLEVLLSNAGQVIEREELVRRVQGRLHNPYDRSIDVHISRLRKKLSSHSDGSERIKAVRGVGHFYSVLANPDKLSNFP